MDHKSFAEAYAKVHSPAKAALVVTKKPDDSYNMITVEWFMRTSITPHQIAISIGHTRYSYDCLEDYPYFNIALPSEELKDALRICGSNSGRDMDKFLATGMQWFAGKLKKMPILKGAIACFECEVVSQVRSGDHTIYVGEVKHSWLDSDKELFVYR